MQAPHPESPAQLNLFDDDVVGPTPVVPPKAARARRTKTPAKLVAQPDQILAARTVLELTVAFNFAGGPPTAPVPGEPKAEGREQVATKRRERNQAEQARHRTIMAKRGLGRLEVYLPRDLLYRSREHLAVVAGAKMADLVRDGMELALAAARERKSRPNAEGAAPGAVDHVVK